MNYRRINIYGSPGSGKSTVAAYVYSHLKMNSHEIELCREPIKNWAYLGLPPKGADQFMLFAQALRNEDVILRSTDDAIVVSDAPLLMHVFHSDCGNFLGTEQSYNMACEYEEQYPSLNILLERTVVPYNNKGRYETEEEANQKFLVLNDFLENLFDDGKISHLEKFNTKDAEHVVSHIVGTFFLNKYKTKEDQE